MISRRSLLTGLSLIPLTGGIVGCAARANPATAAAGAAGAAAPPLGGSIPVVGPGARWNGTALSGGPPPIDPVRTTAKPAIHWLVPSDQRLVSNLTIGVDADAKGGVRQVDFWVEGQVQTVTAPSIYTDTDANGATRSRYGYWITLNASAFKAVSTTGEARLYATAVPNDATMQSRVIGYDAVSGLDGNYPMSVFPRTVANDWSKTVRLDGGGDYASLAAAINAARSAAAEAPLITIAQTGFYEVTNNPGSPINYANGKGFCTVAAASGVTATLGRAAAFTPNNPNSWPWTPGWDGIEFRGAGIVFDQRNWSTITQMAKPCWMNGCKFTNSIGTRDSFYWNGGGHPGFGPSTPSYWDSASVEYVSQGNNGMQGQRYAQGNMNRSSLGDIYSGTNYVAGNYDRDWTANFLLSPINSLRISYANTGGHSTATVTKTGADVPGDTLTLKVDGSAVLTLTLGTNAADTYPTIQSVADAINAFGNGWTAAVLNGRGLMRPSALGGENGGSNPTDANAFNTTLNIIAFFGIHGDWWQGYSGASVRENVMLRNNVLRGANNCNSFLFNDDNDNGGHSYDHIVKGNVWLGTDGTTVAVGNSSFGGASTSHYVFENNTAEMQITRRQATPSDATYSSYRSNIILGAFVDTTNPWNAVTGLEPWLNNFYNIETNAAGSMNTGTSSGNVSYSLGGFAGLFRNYANGDVRPALSGALVSNLVPKVNTFDGTGVANSASDAIGARSITAPAPSYPF